VKPPSRRAIAAPKLQTGTPLARPLPSVGRPAASKTRQASITVAKLSGGSTRYCAAQHGFAPGLGAGRLFDSAFGHATGACDNPDVSRMYFEALKWSLGITDGDAMPRPR